MLGDDGQKQQYIRTVHKKGFIFSASVEISPSREMYRSGSVPVTKRNAFNAVNGSTMAAPGPFLAVTAFSNLSNDPAQAYIADGITEDITTTLSKISKLTVVAYPAVKTRKDFDGDHVQRAREQGVSHLLEGSVQSDEQRLRISVRQAVRKLLAIDPVFSSAAYIEGMPFSDPKIEFRRKAALKNAGMPD